MATTISPTIHQVMSTLLMELMSGQLSDETITAVDRIHRNDVPMPLRDVVGFIHGMSSTPQLRYGIINHLLRDVAAGCLEFAEEREAKAPPMQF